MQVLTVLPMAQNLYQQFLQQISDKREIFPEIDEDAEIMGMFEQTQDPDLIAGYFQLRYGDDAIYWFEECYPVEVFKDNQLYQQVFALLQ